MIENVGILYKFEITFITSNIGRQISMVFKKKCMDYGWNNYNIILGNLHL